MPDSRFFETRGPFRLVELAALTGARLADSARADEMVSALAPLGRAGPGGATFFSDRRYVADLAKTRASACFVVAAGVEALPSGCAALVTPSPLAAFAKASEAFYQPRIHGDEAAIHSEADLEPDVMLSPGVAVGPGARIGSGTIVGPNAVIGPGVAIGRNCRIGANAVIGFALLGDRVCIYAGAVIGEAGFGVAYGDQGAVDVPQLGRVILQDGVTVGANSCVDRGAWDDTVVGENTKMDNLVQIAHNVRIGRNGILAAQVGLAGSVRIGDGVQFGGKAGAGDHITVHDGVRMAAGALTMRDVPEGETWCGVPARPIRQFMRELAWVNQATDKGRIHGGGRQDGDD